MDSVVTIQWGKDDGYGEKENQRSYSGSGSIVPPMGTHFEFWSSINQDGSYRPGLPGTLDTFSGDIQKVVSGIVKSVDYLVEESGVDKNTYRACMHITVTLEEDLANA